MRRYERDSRIREAIHDTLSGVDALPTLRYKVLQTARGEKQVKKKVSLVFVQAAVLLMIVVGAFATTITNPDSDPIHTTQSLSLSSPGVGTDPTPLPRLDHPLDVWADEPLLELVRLLHEAGMGVSTDAYEAVFTAENPGDQAKKLLTAHYSDPNLGSVRGSIFWPWNIKALECDLRQYYGHWISSEERIIMPSGDILSFKHAKEAAVMQLYMRFTMPENFSVTMDLDAALVLHPGETEPVWRFRWWMGESYYEAVLTAQGEPLSWKTPYSMTYTPDTDILAEATILDADVDYMKQLIDNTRMMVTEIGYVDQAGNDQGFDPADVEAAEFTIAHILHPGFNYGLRPVWILEMRVKDRLIGRVLLDESGSYMCTAFGPVRDFQCTVYREFGRIDQLLDSSAIYDADAVTKAELWSKWKPVADAYLDVHPKWSDGTIYYFTQKKEYIAPPPGALTAAQAADIARAYSLELGASPDTMAHRHVLESCLKADDRAVWCITLLRADQEAAGLSNEAWMEDSHHSIFMVTLDAMTGEILYWLIPQDDTPAWFWRY